MGDIIIPIVIVTIYFLLALNAIVFFLIVWYTLKDNMNAIRYKKAKRVLLPLVAECEKNIEKCILLREKIKRSIYERVFIDILLEKEGNLFFIVEKTGLDEKIIDRLKKKDDPEIIKIAGFLGLQKAVDILFEKIDSSDFEVRYNALHALSLLRIDSDRITVFIEKLLNSGINRDRMIEILNNINIPIHDYFDILDNQRSELGKVVIIRSISDQYDFSSEEFCERMTKYLKDDSKEVRIAAIKALSKSKKSKYGILLVQLYKEEKAWEVRAAIAKSMASFPEKIVIPVLIEMMEDDEWWVRFNASESLSKLGESGLETLVDVFLDSEKSSALAYNMLNANKDVFETVLKANQER